MSKNFAQGANLVLDKNQNLATTANIQTPVTKFNQSFHNKTTFDSGKLVPIFAREMLPGDVVDLDISNFIRMSTPTAPTMASPIYDIKFFYVPNRLCWSHWKEFMGENKEAGFQRNYTAVPAVKNISGLKESDLGSYLGLPLNTDLSAYKINSLYARAYCKIFNDWYRDTFLQSDIDFSNNDNQDVDVDFNTYKDDTFYRSAQVYKELAPVNKLPDYFTVALPWPQLGEDTTLFDVTNLYIKNANNPAYTFSPFWVDQNTHPLTQYGILGYDKAGNTSFNESDAFKSDRKAYLSLAVGNKTVQNSTVNNFRLAVVEQQYKELNARTGNRYVDFLSAHFGINPDSGDLQRSEYLGGYRGNVGISNIVQSSADTKVDGGVSPLGNIGGYSITSSQSKGMVSFVSKEHGILMGLVCVRSNITYDKGIDRQFTRLSKLDYYDPLFNNIGEQPVYQYEINAAAKPDAIFGYNEAWADYRWTKDVQSGYLSSLSNLSLSDLYSYTETSTTKDLLNSEWMKYDPKIIGKTLIIDSSTSRYEFTHQFIADFMFQYYITRPMASHSTPGLHKV